MRKDRDAHESTRSTTNNAKVVHRWTTRKLKPVILFWVAMVFAVFIAIAHFAVHSENAVTALALAAIGAIVPLIPGVLTRVEHRLTEASLDRRPVKEKNPAPFETVFTMDDLDYVVAISTGFKFYRAMPAASAPTKFWMKHISDTYSGEVRVDGEDQQTVLDFLNRRGIEIR